MSRVFVYTLLICGLVRVPIFIHHQARTTTDSFTYEHLSRRIMQLDLTDNDGARTPGYPIVLALAKNNREVVFALQCFLGILTSALLFLLTHRTTGNNTAAMIVTLSYSLGVIWLSHEMYILTEILSVFLLILFVFLFEISPKSRKGSLYIVLGLLSAAATLTRPISIVLAITGFVFIAYIQLRERKFYKLFFFVISMAIPILGWCWTNKIYTGYFTITTLGGYSLTNHSGWFMERAPDRYRLIRDMYLEERKIHTRKTGSHVMTIFHIDEEIRKRTGYSYGRLSQELTKLSLELFINNPMLYSKSVFKAWVNFWRPPGPSSQVSLAREGFGQKIFYFLQLPYYLLMSFLFLLITFLILTPARKMFRMSLVDYFCISTILGASFLQALVELGDNARYGISFHPLIMYVVITSLWRAFILKDDQL